MKGIQTMIDASLKKDFMIYATSEDCPPARVAHVFDTEAKAKDAGWAVCWDTPYMFGTERPSYVALCTSKGWVTMIWRAGECVGVVGRVAS